MENNNENQITPTELIITAESMMAKIQPFIDNCKSFEEGMAVLTGLAVMVGTCPLMEDKAIREHILNIINQAATFTEEG